MTSKAQLRQRHGSDTLRLDPYEDNPPASESSINNAWSTTNSPHSHASPLTRPRGSTMATGGPTSGNDTASSVAKSRHRSRSSAYMSPNEAATLLLTKQTDLPPLRVSPVSSHLFHSAETTPLEKVRPQLPVVPTWSNMPAKPQLAILAASRFVDFFQMAALQTYMVHQLQSFDPSLPEATISHQAGMLQGAFTAAQIVTSILWGRLADRPTVGRKMVLIIGLVGTGCSMVGLGFSTTFAQAVAWRVLGGAVNGTVGAARTMVAEAVPKAWHPRAFLLLPAAFNVANVAGPILGGLLVDPVRNLSGLFGPGAVFGGGGEAGLWWMAAYPFAAANMLSTLLLFAEAVVVQLYLHETLKGYEDTPWHELLDVRKAVRWVREGAWSSSTSKSHDNKAASLKQGLLSGTNEKGRDSFELTEQRSTSAPAPLPPTQRRLPFRRIWTPNVLWTLLTIAIFDFHMGAFNNLWTLFLSTRRAYVSPSEHKGAAAASPDPSSFSLLKFGGGLAFPPATIGFAMAILGFIGVTLQFLLYPWANARFGLMRCFRYSLFLFPLAYVLAPYIALLPSNAPSPEPAGGFWVWSGIALVLMLQVSARTFALPASIILLNNSSPHPSVLATIHGLGQADSATFRTLGPILAGSWYGTWLERGVVGMAWWLVAAVSAIGCVGSFYVRNGSGHEILLPGEEEEGGERGVGSMIQRVRRDSVRS